MPLAAKTRILLEALNGHAVDMEKLNSDRAVGVVTLDLQLRWVDLPEDPTEAVIAWASERHGFGSEFRLRSQSGAEIGAALPLAVEATDTAPRAANNLRRLMLVSRGSLIMTVLSKA